MMGLIGFFTGSLVSLVMYSTVVSKRISDLVFQNAALTFELEQRKKQTREDIAVVRNLGTEGQLSQRRSRWTNEQIKSKSNVE